MGTEHARAFTNTMAFREIKIYNLHKDYKKSQINLFVILTDKIANQLTIPLTIIAIIIRLF